MAKVESASIMNDARDGICLPPGGWRTRYIDEGNAGYHSAKSEREETFNWIFLVAFELS